MECFNLGTTFASSLKQRYILWVSPRACVVLFVCGMVKKGECKKTVTPRALFVTSNNCHDEVRMVLSLFE